MKAHRRIRRGNKPSRLIITPMIDIVFQLVLFLLVSSTFSIKPALNLNLPKSSSSHGSNDFELVISVTADGNMYLNGEEIPFDLLSQALEVFDTTYPVAVEADENVTNGKIVKIFDEICKSGFSEVNLRTKENVKPVKKEQSSENENTKVK